MSLCVGVCMCGFMFYEFVYAFVRAMLCFVGGWLLDYPKLDERNATAQRTMSNNKTATINRTVANVVAVARNVGVKKP